jgi:hypothetical protein
VRRLRPHGTHGAHLSSLSSDGRPIARGKRARFGAVSES